MKTRLPLLLLFLVSLIQSPAAIPTVNIFSEAPYLAEGSAIQFIFRKDGPGTAFVPFTFTGTAIEGLNFKTGAGLHSVIIPDDLKELSFLVRTLRDNSTNTDATVILQLSPDPSYTLGAADRAGFRVLELFYPGPKNYVPLVQLTATQWAERIDFRIGATDRDGIAAIWLIVDRQIFASFTNLPSSFSGVSTNYSWTNPPPGRHEVTAVAMDKLGLAAGVSNAPPLVFIVGDQFTFPKEGASSINGLTLTGNLVTSVDNAERRRRLLLEFSIPASATNSEGYLRFRTMGGYPAGPARTNEIFAYSGDGLLSTNDLSVSGEPVARFVSPSGSQEFHIDVTPFIRTHAGGSLGLWINDLPDPARTTGFGSPVTAFSDFKLEILSDSTDEATTARWLNPPVAVGSTIPFFEPADFLFEIVDRDSRVTAVELHSAENGFLAKFEGILFLGTNTVSIEWTNPRPGAHSLFLKTFNEDQAPVAVPIGPLNVDAVRAKVIFPPSSFPTRPAENPFLVEVFVITPDILRLQAELLSLAGTLLDRREVDFVPGTNRISLAWTNPIPGDHVFRVRLNDEHGNSTVGTSGSINIVRLEHEWLYTGDNVQAIHVVDAAGRARVWGLNYNGELGLGFIPSEAPQGLTVPALLLPPDGRRWKQIASSAAFPAVHFNFGLTDDGSLYAWGCNVGGIFGVKTFEMYRTSLPIKVTSPPEILWWRKIACSRFMVGGLDQNRDLWRWGPSMEPLKTKGPWLDLRIQDRSCLLLATNGMLTNISGFSSGVLLPNGIKATREYSTCISHSLAIGEDGQLYAWGSNNNGELPLSLASFISSPTAAGSVSGVQSWTQVATARNLSLAVDNNGRLFSWGSSTNTGARQPIRNQPALVDIHETSWLDIAVNPAFAMALSERGNLYVWGTIFADTSSLRRTIRFPELVQGLPALLDPNFTATLATFDPSSLKASPDFSLSVIAPANTPMEIQYSSDLQTWHTLTNILTSATQTRFLHSPLPETNTFFRIR